MRGREMTVTVISLPKECLIRDSLIFWRGIKQATVLRAIWARYHEKEKRVSAQNFPWGRIASSFLPHRG